MSKVAQETANVAVSAVSEFGKLMKDFNVVGFALGLLIANAVGEMANSFIDGILMPTVQPMIDNVTSKNTQITIGNFTIKLDKFINAVLKFLMIAVVIFVLMKLGVSMTKPVTWVRIVGNKPDLNLK